MACVQPTYMYAAPALFNKCRCCCCRRYKSCMSTASCSASETMDDLRLRGRHLHSSPQGGHANPRQESASNMYLDVKADMLGIIEEGLKLKLEITSIKEQFLGLLKGFDKYQSSGASPKLLQPKTNSPGMKHLSEARRRARAVLEERRSRIMARRAARQQQLDINSNLPAPKTPSCVDVCLRTPLSEINMTSNYAPVNSTPCQNTIQQDLLPKQSPLTNPQLTPICEEPNYLFTPVKPANKPNVCSSGATSLDELTDIEGEYVTLKKSASDGGEYVTLKPTPVAPRRGYNSCYRNNDTSVWDNNTKHHNTVELSAQDYSSSPEKMYINHINHDVSPSQVKYASSDAISKLYMSKSLRDISQISKDISHISDVSGNGKSLKDVSQINRVSKTTLREQFSGSNINGPLHSTMMYPQHSTPEKDNQNSTHAIVLSDACTTISEPSSGRKFKVAKGSHSTKIRSIDDTYMDNVKLMKKVERQFVRPKTREHRRSRRSMRSSSSSENKENAFKQYPRHKLCKEYTLHNKLQEPCMFHLEDSLAMFDNSISDGDQPHNYCQSETEDCDSSYLSECMDGGDFVEGFDEAEEYTATYDSRNARMKMLKRQTAQVHLGNLKYPVGLSESDLLEATKKHLSLEATRASLPDLSALSTPPSDEGNSVEAQSDSTESTFHETMFRTCLESSFKESDGVCSPMNNTLVVADQRPLSIATSTTTTDDSPISSGDNRGMIVPVNSPNVTDSGSSSKPTTDNYDYVELPLRSKVMPPPMLPPRVSHLPPTPRQFRRNNPRTVGACRPPSGAASRAMSRQQGGARKCLRYCTECDSGFSTASGRARAQQGRHFTISDAAGVKRTVIQHSAVARNLQRDRKRALVKKLKQFSNSINRMNSTGSMQIQTLGHF